MYLRRTRGQSQGSLSMCVANDHDLWRHVQILPKPAARAVTIGSLDLAFGTGSLGMGMTHLSWVAGHVTLERRSLAPTATTGIPTEPFAFARVVNLVGRR
jgi:hypothetical protein